MFPVKGNIQHKDHMDNQLEERMGDARKEAVWNSNEYKTFAELDAVMHKWLEIKDWGLNKVIPAFIIANQLPGNAVWALLVGGSGSGKTVYISGLNYIPFIYTLSSLTPQTLISGQKGTQGLLWELGGKVLAMKDLTTILEMNSDARSEILSQFREIYDGYYEKAYGTGDVKKWHGKVGFIAGVTSIIDIREQSYSALGERFIKYRIIEPDRITIARRALKNTTHMAEMDDEIRSTMAMFVKGTLAHAEKGEQLELEEEQQEQLIRLADFATLARSPVTRDFGMTKEVIYKPSSEMPTRFTQQLSQIAIALRLINKASGDGNTLLEIDNKILFKIALDSIPQMRRQMLQKLAENISITTEEAAEATSYPTATARRYLEDLFVLGICERSRSGGGESGSHNWTLKGKYRAIMAEFDGVKMMDEDKIAELEAEYYADAEEVRSLFAAEENKEET